MLTWQFASHLDTVRIVTPLSGDSVIGFDTTLNVDSLGRGLHQFFAYYKYKGSGQWVSGFDTYDNIRGSSDGRSVTRIYAYDSLNHAYIADVDIGIYTIGGQYRQSGRTLAGGFRDFFLSQSGSYKIYASGPPGYTFGLDTVVVDTGTTGVALDTILGYNAYDLYIITAPADSTLCKLYGYVRDQDQKGVKYAKVTITPPRDQRYNICDKSQILMMRAITRTTDTAGYFEATILKCNCMPDTLAEYKIKIAGDGVETRTESFVIPRDSSTYLMGAFE
jgi:hypothetical protein